MSEAKVLLVEDNRDSRDAIRLLLEREGFRVITAEDCHTAFNYLSDYDPDVVVTDLMLAEMTGLEFIRWVRRTVGFEDIPIIAMTAYDQNYLAVAILAGANTVLHKPEGLDHLVEAIHKVLPGDGRANVA